VTKPGEREPKDIDSDALTRAILDYADQPDLADGIRALGVFAASLAEAGSPAAGRAVVRALESVGAELERRIDAGEIAAALDDVCVESSAFAK
jgi:hypothetical protein